MQQHFKCHIRKGVSNRQRYHLVLVGLNSEDTLSGENQHSKKLIKDLCKSWFPDAEIIDETLKKK